MKTTTYREVKVLTKERIFEVIEKSLEFGKENNFQIKDQNFDFEKLKTQIESELIKSSLKKRKRLNKLVTGLECKISRKKINYLFHFLDSRFNIGMSIRFNPSLQEQDMIGKRESYKKLKQKLNEMVSKFKLDNNYDDSKKSYLESKKKYFGSGNVNTEYVER